MSNLRLTNWDFKTIFLTMKLLLIEDQCELAKSIIDYLVSYNFVCEWVKDEVAAIEKISIYEYDCILLDLMLPNGNGFEVLKEIKRQQNEDGVIIISAKETLESRIEGFNLGADDYLTKPFHLSELLVRIQALIRRKKFNGYTTINFNEIEVNVFSKKVTIEGKVVDFTKKEINLLMYLIGNQNKILSKAAIAEHLSGDMADMMDNHDFIYAHIKNLKNKFRESGCKDYIKTVYGFGYKWQNE
jgi:DNA-binding response OmpR family regulator